MTIKYIKNCTGNDCAEEKFSSRFSVFFSRFIFRFLLTSFVLVLVYILFFSQYLKILNIEISGNDEISEAQIRSSVDEMLKEKYFSLIPKNNFIFVSENVIGELLKNDFKKIRSVMIQRKFPDFVSIEIEERKALLVWCSNGKCCLIDEGGTAYNEANFQSPEMIQNNLIKIVDTSGRDVVMGENILEQSYEAYVLEARNALGQAYFTANGEYSTPSRMAQEIRIKTFEGVELYFSTQFSLKSAISTLNMIIDKEITRKRIGELEYIDLRNENKVFYKFKNVTPENVEGNNAETR